MKLGTECVYVTLLCIVINHSWVVQCANKKKDYYQILGIPRSATDRDIKKAFRKMAVKYHPDKNKSADAEATFRDIAEAHEVLSDEKKRRIYDQYGEDGLKDQAGFDSSNFHGSFSFDDFFKDFQFPFGGGGNQGGHNGGSSFFEFEDDGDDHFGDSFFGNFGGFASQMHMQQDEDPFFSDDDHHHHHHHHHQHQQHHHHHGHHMQDMEDGFGSFGFGDDMFGDGVFTQTRTEFSSSSSSSQRCKTVTKKVGNMVMTSTECH